MADRVLRMTHIGDVRTETRADRVVLIIEGVTGGKNARVELALDYMDLRNVIMEMRRGVKVHVERWQITNRELNNG